MHKKNPNQTRKARLARPVLVQGGVEESPVPHCALHNISSYSDSFHHKRATGLVLPLVFPVGWLHTAWCLMLLAVKWIQLFLLAGLKEVELPVPQFVAWVLFTGRAGPRLYSEQTMSYNQDVSDCTIRIFFSKSKMALQ